MVLSCRQIFLCVTLLVTLDRVCYSQIISPGDSLESQLLFELFDNAVGIESTEIINGPKHILLFPGSGTHPFYNSSAGEKGSVTFSGQPYFNLTLLYDIYSDDLVVQTLRSTGTRELIVVDKGKVAAFRIYGHVFKNFKGTVADSLGVDDGFYDVLFQSKAFALIARRKKNTKVEMGVIQFESADKLLFIQPGRKAATFRGMNGFYQVLDDKDSKAELRAFVKRGNLRIMKSDADLVETARYCDMILSRRK
jgi:hypothetical protein